MPQTLLLRIPAPGQDETEWLSIDEAGGRSPRSSAGHWAWPRRLRGRRRSWRLRRRRKFCLAEPELPPGSGVKLARAVPFALEEQLTEDIDAVVLCASDAANRAGARRSRWCRAACSKAGCRSSPRRGIEPDAIYADISLVPDNPGQTILWLEKLAARRAPPGQLAVRGRAHTGRRGAGGRRGSSGSARGAAEGEEGAEPQPLESAVLYVTREDWALVQHDFQSARRQVRLPQGSDPHGRTLAVARADISPPPMP